MRSNARLFSSMAVITVANLVKAFGTQGLFRDVSLTIGAGERAALIGANGSGKTTLLRIICGEEPADEGSVSIEQGVTLGYLPQEVDLPLVAELHLAVMGVTPELLACGSELRSLEKKIHAAASEHAHALGSRYAELSHQFDTLGGFNYLQRARAILLGLGFEETELEQPVRTLSGGQKTRAALARLLLLAPDVLLLDEPTNHLDIRACDWLQEFLNTKYNGAALIVSHDRYFMDGVVSRVLEIDNMQVASYPGNYSKFARLKAERIEEQRKLFKEQKKEIARLETAIQTLFSHRKFSRRDSKVRQLERVKRVDLVSEQRTMSAQFGSAIRSGREVLRLTTLSKSFPGKELFSDLSILIERGTKIGIVGPNGSGKSTLLKIIAGHMQPDAGEIMLGHNVQPVYFAQEFDHLVTTRSVIEELLADADITSLQARNLLAQFLFFGDDAFKQVGVLSGGELCRLALAKVLAQHPNLLLLDEPTNHLDIRSREALEDALRSFDGTLVVASHDRYLLDTVAGEILEISEGSWTRFAGRYSEYREKTLAAREPELPTTPASTAPAARPVSSLREAERLLRDLNKKHSQLEDSVSTLEEKVQRLTQALGDPDNYRDGSARDLATEYDNASAALHDAYEEWERLAKEIADTQGLLATLKDV